MPNQEIKNRVVELKNEHFEATPSRRIEIEKEIVTLAPKNLFPVSSELRELKKPLKSLEEKVRTNAISKEEFEKQMAVIVKSIKDYKEKALRDLNETRED